MHDDKIDFEQFLSFKQILGIVCEMQKSAVAFKSVLTEPKMDMATS
jgi:hypothetical protein